MENKQGNILGTQPIGQLLLKFAVPSIIAMQVSALYNIVDQIFIGHSVTVFDKGIIINHNKNRANLH